MAKTLPIKGFIEASLIDFPLGQPGSVIFIAGCDARCPYCQASHLVEGFDRIPTIPLESILASLAELRSFIKAVTVTGGEVTLYPELPTILLGPLRDMGFNCNIHTYGARPDRIDSWIRQGYVQALNIDIKGPWRKYKDILNRPIDAKFLTAMQAWVQKIMRDSRLLSVEYRTTVHPSLLTIEEIIETAEQIRGAEMYILQNYKPVPGFDPSLQYQPSYSIETLREVANQIQEQGIVRHCLVGGFMYDTSQQEVTYAHSN